MPKTKNHKIVEVTWVDPAEFSGWNGSEALAFQPSHCKSVGYLIHQTKKQITLSDTIATDQDQDYGACLVLPRGVVVSIKTVK